VVSFTPQQFYSWRRKQRYTSDRRLGEASVEKRKISYSYRESSHNSSTIQPTA
jgi:hypothetical protein